MTGIYHEARPPTCLTKELRTQGVPPCLRDSTWLRDMVTRQWETMQGGGTAREPPGLATVTQCFLKIAEDPARGGAAPEGDHKETYTALVCSWLAAAFTTMVCVESTRPPLLTRSAW